MRAKITLTDWLVLIFPDWENISTGPVCFMRKHKLRAENLRKDEQNGFIFRKKDAKWLPVCRCCLTLEKFNHPPQGKEEELAAAKAFVKGRVAYEGSGLYHLGLTPREVDNTAEVDIMGWWDTQ